MSLENRKRLGQCFTGMQTARILSAISLKASHKRIIDPMAGHGDLLHACAERASRLKSSIQITGVEIDQSLTDLGLLRMMACCQEYGFPPPIYKRADAFQPATWNLCGDSVPYDLVITNPPYVRYQTLSQRSIEDGSEILDASSTRRLLAVTADQWSHDLESPLFRELIRAYSGFADLSVPSWLLCGLLTRPGGTLALVVPQTWLNRDYAKVIRYFYLRFFNPIMVIQEFGRRLFKDALIPVSLVVGHRLNPPEVLVPISHRKKTNAATQFIELGSEAATPESHVGSAFPRTDPEGAFVEWISAPHAKAPPGIKRFVIPLQLQRDEVLAACRDNAWFNRLETTMEPRLVKRSKPDTGLPPTLTMHIPKRLLKCTQPLSATPVRVGQGLRTGCNSFFYVDELPGHGNNGFVRVRTSKLLGEQEMSLPASILLPVLRRQGELTGMRIDAGILRGRVLDLRDFQMPDTQRSHKRQAFMSITETLRTHMMPIDLVRYIKEAEQTKAGKEPSLQLIPQLSAVRTNGSSQKTNRRETHLPRRQWYMLPSFSARHRPQLFLPRILHNQPLFYLNDSPPVIIDANFSTLWSEDKLWTSQAVFAIMNSTWVQLCIEAIASPMGGGALKVEATHIRRIPLPQLDPHALDQLTGLGSHLEAAEPIGGPATAIIARIDRLVFSCLSGDRIREKEAGTLICQLRELVRTLYEKRQKNGQKLEAP